MNQQLNQNIIIALSNNLNITINSNQLTGTITFNSSSYFDNISVGIDSVSCDSLIINSPTLNGTNFYIITNNFSGINLTNINFSGITLSDIILDNYTILGPLNSSPIVPSGINVITTTGPTLIYGSYLVGPNSNLSNYNLKNVLLTDLDSKGVYISSNTKLGPLNSNSTIQSNSEFELISASSSLGIGLYLLGPNANLSNFTLYSADLSKVNLLNVNLSNITINNNIILGPLNNSNYPTISDGFEIIHNNTGDFLIGPNANLENINLSGSISSGSYLDLSGIYADTSTTVGPIQGSVTISSQISNYEIIQNNQGKFLIGPNLDLSGIDISSADISYLNNDIIMIV